MIVFVTVAGHDYTVANLVSGRFGEPSPIIHAVTWETLLRRDFVPHATYVLTDIDRLYAWELPAAGEVYRALRQAGLRVLNDPARVKARYELLRGLHRIGFNPFDVYRADDAPRPVRFPVFVRAEADHLFPVTELLADQAALDAALERLRAGGMALRGLLVVEFCAEPVAPGVWIKTGTYRIGDGLSVDHTVIEDTWLVKYGKPELRTEALALAEQAAIHANAAEALWPAFRFAGIEWGRADHAEVGGRTVVYEINTNPAVGSNAPQRRAIRYASLAFARRRMGELLFAIDSPAGPDVPIEVGPQVAAYRARPRSGRDPLRP